VTGVPLGPGGEFDRIRAIARVLGPGAMAIGDDCAVVPPGDGALVVSTDASVEQVHFRLDWIRPREVGWRAAAGALSDLAAAGAAPVGLLAALVAPRQSSEDDTVALMSGIAAAAALVEAPLLGGDLSAGPSWVVTITVLGRAELPVSRGGARAGDGLWLTGSLGGPRAAVEAWSRGEEPSPDARRAFAEPAPRIAAGRWLAAHGARAMVDLSDGLAGDAAHLAAASGVALEIELEALPVAPAAAAEARKLGMTAAAFAAEGGEDYELLVALPAETGDGDARELERASGVTLTRIGRVLPGAGARLTLGGHPVALRGYDHFR
jgi:thiamine-monophosphate kinase